MQNKFLRSELTKGSSFILAFSFLALFSFQDAVGAAFKVFASSGDLFIIPHFRKFVKSFFQSFLKFFFLSLWRLSAHSSVSLDQLASFSIIPHFQKFVKRFLKIFQDLFEIFSLASLCGFSCPHQLSDSRPAWLQTLLLYHISELLSRGF